MVCRTERCTRLMSELSGRGGDVAGVRERGKGRRDGGREWREEGGGGGGGVRKRKRREIIQGTKVLMHAWHLGSCYMRVHYFRPYHDETSKHVFVFGMEGGT